MHARQLDELRDQGATGALWFAPIAGVSPLEVMDIFTDIITKVKPLMSKS